MIKKTTILTGALLLIGAVSMKAWQGEVTIETPNSQLLLTAQEGSDLRQLYYGDKSATIQQLRDAGAASNFEAMPAFGSVDPVHLPALHVQHMDGDQNLELQVADYSHSDDGKAIVHVFTMKDKLLPVTVKLFYKAYKQVDVIEAWTQISHQEKKAVTLKRFDSGHLTLRQGDVWITHLHGNWGAEAEPTTEPLTMGL
jgi:alpha-galactosidase